MTKKNNVYCIIKKLVNTGFLHIFSSQVIVKIISFCSAMLIVRILSKDEYGLYSYAANIISMFMLLDGLGTASAALQYGSENYTIIEKKNAYLKFGFSFGLVFNCIIALAIIVSTYCIPFKIKGAQPLLLLMSAQPLLSYILSSIQNYLRIEIRNKEFSTFNIIQSITTIIATISGAYYYGVYGVVLFQYISSFILIFIGINLARDYLDVFKVKIQLVHNEIRGFINYSVVCAFNNGISGLLYSIDVFIIGLFFPDISIIATYKTATVIPFALNFIPSAVVTYIYPYFARNNKDKSWVYDKYKLLIKYFGLFNFFLTIVLVWSAPLIVKIIFGEQYIDAVLPFRILSIGYFINATFRMTGGNIIAMLHKVKFNLYVAIGSGLMNCILNVPFIKFFGPVGASTATVIIFSVTAFANTVYIRTLLKGNSEKQ